MTAAAARRDLLPDLVAAALAGTASLGAEIAAVRVFAPWNGQSALVWSNAIGVSLAALAVGAAVGGRWAGREDGRRRLAFALALGGLALAVGACLAPRLAAALAPSDLAGDRPTALALPASLAGGLAVLALPSLAIGALWPVVVASLGRRLGAGPAAGRVSAASTLGSLLACAVVSTRLVPTLGSRGTLAACGAALAIAAALVARPTLSRALVAVPTAAPHDRAPPIAGVAAAIAAFLVGVAVTGVEFGVVRALAPRFGQTSQTWAVVLGVALLGLALGAALGGRWGRRADPRPPLWVASGVGAVWLAAAGVFAGGVPMPGGAAAWAAFLFLVPLAAFGAVPPLLVRACARGTAIGAAAARVYAFGTAGAVAGCYLAPLAAIPFLGTSATLLACAGLGCVAAVVASWIGGAPRPEGAATAPEATSIAPPSAASQTAPSLHLARGVAVGALVACVALLVGVRVWGGPLRRDPGQLEEVEGAYQSVRVVEEQVLAPGFGPTPRDSLLDPPILRVRTRALRYDEDVHAYQSVLLAPGAGTSPSAGRYYDHLALGAWFRGMPWALAGPPQRPLRVLVIGYGGGTQHRVLRATAPYGARLEVLGVEVDPAAIDVSRRHLALGDLEGDELDLRSGEDGRAVLRSLGAERRFDLVFVDAYQRTQYVPFHLATVEFFEACRGHLEPHGVIGMNVHAESGSSGRLLRSIAASLRLALRRREYDLSDAPQATTTVVANPLYPGNVTLWGSQGDDSPPLDVTPPRSIEAAAYAYRETRTVLDDDPTARVLTDDLAPVEWLADEPPTDPTDEERARGARLAAAARGAWWVAGALAAAVAGLSLALRGRRRGVPS